MVEQQLAHLLVGNHVIILTLLDAAEVEIGVLLHGLEEAVEALAMAEHLQGA